MVANGIGLWVGRCFRWGLLRVPTAGMFQHIPCHGLASRCQSAIGQLIFGRFTPLTWLSRLRVAGRRKGIQGALSWATLSNPVDPGDLKIRQILIPIELLSCLVPGCGGLWAERFCFPVLNPAQ